MRNLHPRYRTLLLNKCCDLRQFIDVFVLPDPEISRRDPASRLHRGSLSENQCGTADGAASQVNQMPVICKAVLARVFAHWRNRDPVPKIHSANG
jgi:hypothetical protein